MADFLNDFSIFDPVPGSPADFLRKVGELRRQASDLQALALSWLAQSDELLAIASSLIEQADKLDALREKRVQDVPQYFLDATLSLALEEERTRVSKKYDPFDRRSRIDFDLLEINKNDSRENINLERINKKNLLNEKPRWRPFEDIDNAPEERER